MLHNGKEVHFVENKTYDRLDCNLCVCSVDKALCSASWCPGGEYYAYVDKKEETMKYMFNGKEVIIVANDIDTSDCDHCAKNGQSTDDSKENTDNLCGECPSNSYFKFKGHLNDGSVKRKFKIESNKVKLNQNN